MSNFDEYRKKRKTSRDGNESVSYSNSSNSDTSFSDYRSARTSAASTKKAIKDPTLSKDYDWSSVTANADFSQYNQYSKGYTSDSNDSDKNFVERAYNNAAEKRYKNMYDYLNGGSNKISAGDVLFDSWQNIGSSNGHAQVEQFDKGYVNMTDTQKEIFNYYYNSPDYGWNYARRYLNSISGETSQKEYEKMSQISQALVGAAADKGVKGDRKILVAGALSSVNKLANTENLGNAIGQSLVSLIDEDAWDEYNPYVYGQGAQAYQELVSSSAAQAFKEKYPNATIAGINIPSAIAGGLTSEIESEIGMRMFGPQYTMVMGTQAYVDSLRESKERGLDAKHAVATSFASGATEVISEMIGDKFPKLKGNTKIASVVNAFIGTVGEGSEELVGGIMNTISDQLINWDNSELSVSVNDYMSQGYSEEDAWSQALKDLGVEYGESFVSGAIAGGIGNAYGTAANNKKYARIGKNVDREQLSETLKTYDENSDIYKEYAKRAAKKGENLENFSNTDVGMLYSAAYKDASAREKKASLKEYLTSNGYEEGVAIDYSEAYAAEEPTRAQQKLMKSAKYKEALSGYNDSVKAGNAAKTAEITKAKFQQARLENADKKRINTDGYNIGETTSVKGEEAKIIGIASDGVHVITDKGTTSVKSMVLSQNDAELISTAFENYKTAASRNAFIENYKGQNLKEYTSNFDLAFAAGRYGLKDQLSVVDSNVIDTTTAEKIYLASYQEKAESHKEFEKGAEELNKKWDSKVSSGTFTDKEVKIGGKTYSVEKSRLSSSEKIMYNFLKAFSKLGVNVSVFKDVNDNSYNGEYDKETNTIYINLAARYAKGVDILSSRQYVVSTVAHELTHWLEINGVESYGYLNEAIKNAYGNTKYEQLVAKEMFDANGKAILSRKAAESEVAARACEDMLNDTEVMSQILSNMEETKLEKLRNDVVDFFAEVKELFADMMKVYHSEAEAASILRANEEAFNEVKKIWVDGISNALNGIAAVNEISETGEAIVESAVEGDSRAMSDAIVESTFKAFDVSKLPRVSGAKVIGRNIIKGMDNVKAYNFAPFDVYSDKEVENALTDDKLDLLHFSRKYDDRIYNDALKYDTNAQKGKRRVSSSVWADAKRLRTKVKDKLNEYEKFMPEDNEETLGKTFPKNPKSLVLTGNSSYGLSGEHALICVRSLVNNWFNDRVAEAIKRPLTVIEQIASQSLLANVVGNQRECLYCYVAADRKSYNEALLNYYNWYAGMKDKVNSNRKSYEKEYAYIKKNLQAIAKTLTGKEGRKERYAAISDNLPGFNEFVNGKAPTKNMLVRYYAFLDDAINNKETITAEDLSSEAKREVANMDATKQWMIHDAELYAHGASHAKSMHRPIKVNGKKVNVKYVAYNGSVMKLTDTMVENLNSQFGLRLYSDSDYVPAFLLEDMQIVTDAAVRGLKMLAYTKDIGFAKVMAKTGMGINISTFASMNSAYKNDAELNELRAKYKELSAANEGDTDTKEVIAAREAYLAVVNKYIEADAMQGAGQWNGRNNDEVWAPVKEARKLSDTIGTVMVATNDDIVEWAMAQDWIDVVIPYHLVFAGEDVAAYHAYKDYKSDQEDKKKKDWSAAKEANPKLLSSIPPTVHKNDLSTYKKALEDNHLTARFPQFAKNPNYMKLVNETRQAYDYCESVQPIFDEKAIDEELARIPNEGKYGLLLGTTTEEEQERLLSDSIETVVDNIRNGRLWQNKTGEFITKEEWDKLNAEETTLKSAKIDAEYMDAVNSEDMDKAAKLVEKAAKAAGYIIRAYHGTNALFNTFSYEKLGSKNFNASSAYMGFFASKSKETAESYIGLNQADLLSMHLNKASNEDIERIKSEHNYDEVNKKYLADKEAFENKYKSEHGYKEEVTDIVNQIINNSKSVLSLTEEAENRLRETMLTSYEYDWNKKNLNEMISAWENTSEYSEFANFEKEIYSKWEANEIKRKGYTPNIKNLYIKMEKPFVYDFKGEERDVESFAARMNYAKENGYDGCIFKNVSDGADIDDIYAVFSNTQLKSADTVVYDDAGNIIPLSERFNSDNEDIRYSTKKNADGSVDIGSGTILLSDESVDHLIKYYGSKSDDKYTSAYIARIDPFYFLKLTTGYGMLKLGNIKNWDSAENDDFDIDKLADVYKGSHMFLRYDGNQIIGHEGRHRMAQLMKMGYDRVPVIIKVPYEEGNKEYQRMIRPLPQVFDPSFDRFWDSDRAPIYDLYPLNQENRETIIKEYGTNNIDYRIGLDTTVFSKKVDREVYDILGEKNRLEKENIKLKADVIRLTERIKLNNTITNGKVFKRSLVEAAAKALIKSADSTYDMKTLADELDSLYHFMQDPTSVPEDMEADEITARCYEIAGKLLEKQKPTVTKQSEIYDQLKDIRSQRIALKEETIKELKKRDGDKWRNLYMGRIMITKDGKSMESVYGALASRYSWLFDPSISDELQQLDELSEVYDALKDTKDIIEYHNSAEDTRYLAVEIFDKFWTMANEVTVADKHAAEVKALKEQHKSTVKELKQSIENQKLADEMYFGKKLHKQQTKSEEQINKLKASQISREEALTKKKYYQEMVKNVRDKKNTEIANLKKHQAELKEKQREALRRKAAIEKITDNAKTLMEWMDKNSAKEHVPDVLKGPVRDLLTSIDFSSKQLLGMTKQIKNPEKYKAPTMKDVSLLDALERVREVALKAENPFDEKGNVVDAEIAKISGMFPPGFSDMVKNSCTIAKYVSKHFHEDNVYVLNYMNADELESLSKLVKALKKAVTNYNKALSARENRTITEFAQQTIFKDMKALGADKTQLKVMKEAKKWLVWENLNPIYAFRRMGEGALQIYELLQDGWDQFAKNINEINTFVSGLYTAEEVDRWTKDIHEFEILQLNEDGENTTVKMKLTVTQMMSLYCLSRREQAVGHIFGGGIKIMDINQGLKVITQADTYHPTSSEMDVIIHELSKVDDGKAMDVAEKLQEYMSKTGGAWGNKITQKRFGIDGFTEEFYFPIASNKNNLPSEPRKNAMSIYALLNLSFTKALTKEAQNEIYVDDIFTVFTTHMSEMAKYNALALPVLDAIHWFNYTESTEKDAYGRKITYSVRGALDKALGEKAQDYVRNFITDINGTQESGRNETLPKKLIKNFKIAQVGGNLQVVALQPVSLFRAGCVIDEKYIAAGVVKRGQIEKAQKYCGIVLWKKLGFYDTNISRGLDSIIRNGGTDAKKFSKEWIQDKSLAWAEKADEWTLGHLWNACEKEISEKNPKLKYNSEEYNEAVAKRLREVVYKTQVVDSTMTRSELMRSQSLAAQEISSFMSEPTLSLNTVIDAAYEFTEALRKGDGKGLAVKKAWPKFRRAAQAYILCSVAESAIRAAFGKLRALGDDDDDDTWLDKFIDQLIEELIIFGKIPIVKDIISIFQGYKATNNEVAFAQNAYYAYKSMKNNGLWNYKTIYRSAMSLGQLSGTPGGGLIREFSTAWNSVMKLIGRDDLFIEK